MYTVQSMSSLGLAGVTEFTKHDLSTCTTRRPSDRQLKTQTDWAWPANCSTIITECLQLYCIDLSYDNNNDLFTIADFNQFAMLDCASICVYKVPMHNLAFSPATNENWLSSPIPWRRLHDWINYSVRRVYTQCQVIRHYALRTH